MNEYVWMNAPGWQPTPQHTLRIVSLDQYLHCCCRFNDSVTGRGSVRIPGRPAATGAPGELLRQATSVPAERAACCPAPGFRLVHKTFTQLSQPTHRTASVWTLFNLDGAVALCCSFGKLNQTPRSGACDLPPIKMRRAKAAGQLNIRNPECGLCYKLGLMFTGLEWAGSCSSAGARSGDTVRTQGSLVRSPIVTTARWRSGEGYSLQCWTTRPMPSRAISK